MPSSATNRNRKARQQAKSDTEAILAAAAAGTLAATSATAGANAGAGAAGAGATQQILAAGAESAQTAATVALIIAALAAARGGVGWLRDVLRPEFPPEQITDADIAEAAELERQREADFIEAMRFRLNRDLPEALKQSDPDAAVAALLEREQRYMEQHDDATAARVEAFLKRKVVKSISPEGAYWVLDPSVKEHTPDCIALASVGWWPWSVLDQIHPPVHTGCRCDLLTRDQAIGFGYIEADEPLMEDDEARLRAEVITRQYDLGEGWRYEPPMEGDSPHDLMELRWNRRYARGTIWGGRFMPRRGGFAPRISIREIIRALDGPDIDVVGRGSERTVAAPDLGDVPSMRSPKGGSGIPVPGERLTPSTPEIPARGAEQPSALAGEQALGRTRDFIKAMAERRGGTFGDVSYFTMDRVNPDRPSGGGGRREGPNGSSQVFLGEREQMALKVVADKLARGETPTHAEAMRYWDARRLANHETIHTASPITIDEYRRPDGYALEEALTEELAQAVTADQLQEEGATDILNARMANPDDKFALGVYRRQRAGLMTVLDYGEVPEEDRRDLIERLALEVGSTDERIKILAGYVAEAQGVDEQRAIDIVRGAMFESGSDPRGLGQLGIDPYGQRDMSTIYPGMPGASVLSPGVDTIDPSLGFAYGDEVTVDGPDGSYTGRVIASGTYDGQGELKVEVDGPDGRSWRHPLVSEVRGGPGEPERDAGGMVRPDSEPTPQAPDGDMPQGEAPALMPQNDALMRGDGAGGPTLRPEEREMLTMASPALLDSLDDGEGPVEQGLRRTLNQIGVDPYDLDIEELRQHAATHEGAPRSRVTIAGRGASVCANSRDADFAIHLLLPEMLREKYPDLAEELRATSPRWGRRQDQQMPLGMAKPEAPEMASPGAETVEAQRDAIDVGDDVNLAADLLAAGYRVKLDQPRTVSILREELLKRVEAAKAKGEDAPNFDLCDIYVPGTNLFCSESKGIPRNKMPQLSGVPVKGSPASELEPIDTGGVGEEGIVDIMPQFRERLAEMGVETTEEEVPASHLRATQSELNGGKVAGIAEFLSGGGTLEGAIIVSSDDYVVDGHHRWAAQVSVDADDGKLGDVPQQVIRVDMPILELLELANNFAGEMGLPQVDVKEDKAAARRELAKKGKLPEAGAPEMPSPATYDDQAVERMGGLLRSGSIGRMGSPILVSGLAKERAAADGKNYDELSTEEKRQYVEAARDEFWALAIKQEPDSELRDLAGDPRLGSLAQAELDSRAGAGQMASPSEIGGTPFRPEDADDPEGFQRKLADYQRRFAETAEALGVEEMANREQQGVWNGEPEPSVATDLGDVDDATALAAAAIMGRHYGQDAMAVFAAADDGPGGRFAVRIPEGLDDQELLDRITEGMPEGEGASILDGMAYFYAHDYDEGVASADSLAEALDSDWQAERGTFTLISDEDYGDITYEQAIGEAVGQARDLATRWESEDRNRGQAPDTGGGEGAGPEAGTEQPGGDPRDPRGDGDPGAVAPEPAMASPDPDVTPIPEMTEAEASELITSDRFFTLPFEQKLQLVEKLGVDDYPGPGPVGKELLGGAPDTQQKYKSRSGNYTQERNKVHSKIKGMLAAGYSPEDSEEQGRPVYRGGLTELLGADHPITQKVINEGIDALTEDDREFIREAASLARGGQPPEALFMAGGAAVGKSSALKADPSLKPANAATINSDDIKVMLPEYKPQVDAGEKGAAPSVHEESSDTAKSLRDTLMELGLNVVVDGTGNNNTTSFERKLREMKGAGYTVDVVVVNLPTDEAMTRAVRRAVESGRYVPTETLRKAHSMVSQNIERLADADFIRSIAMFDNNVPFGEPPIRFAQVNNGEMEVLDQELLDTFYAKGNEVAEREAYDRTVGIQEAKMEEQGEMTMPDNPIPPERWTYWVPGDWVDFLSREPIEIVTEDGRLLDSGGKFIRDLSPDEIAERNVPLFDESDEDEPEDEQDDSEQDDE